MIIVWRGLGFVVPAIVLAFHVIAVVIGKLMSDDMYGRDVGNEPTIIAWLTSAVAIWLIGRKFNRAPIERNPEIPDGVIISVKPDFQSRFQHTLFWIPIEYWSLVCLGFAILRYLS